MDCAFLKDGPLCVRIKVRIKLKVVLITACVIAGKSCLNDTSPASHDGQGESKRFDFSDWHNYWFSRATLHWAAWKRQMEKALYAPKECKQTLIIGGGGGRNILYENEYSLESVQQQPSSRQKENSVFSFLNGFCYQTPWQGHLPPAFHKPLVLPPSDLHHKFPPSLLPCRHYKEIGPRLWCQAASLVPAFLHIHILLFYFHHVSSMSGRRSAHPQSLFSSILFFLKSLLC